MLPHLASRLFGTPLLVQRAKLEVILSVLGERIGVSPQAVPPNAEAAMPRSSQGLPDNSPGIAVIPVYGTLVKRTLGLEAASGLMSYAEIGAMLEAAAADSSVRGILLDVDSPGGEVGGVFELAARVREIASMKPVWAIANDDAFSAAYTIACAANRVIVTQTGGVGSIGVIALHVDQSVKDANDGLRFTPIFAGARKDDFSPHKPLDDDAQAALQAEVDRLYGIFTGHVAAMRSLPEEAVRATDAALYFGSNAVDAGLADDVGSLSDAIKEFTVFLSPASRKQPSARANTRTRAETHRKEQSMNEEAGEVIGADQAAALVAEARREESSRAQAIVDLCALAGCPMKAAEYLAAGKTELEVRRELLALKAAGQSPEIVSTIDPDARAGTLASVNNPLIAATKKLIGKE